MDKRILMMKNTASHFKKVRWLGSFFNCIDLLKKKKKCYVYKYRGNKSNFKAKIYGIFLDLIIVFYI